MKWESYQYVKVIKQKCKELALKGYGSVEIELDKTCDYCNFILKLLKQEGFTFGKDFTNILIWDDKLPQAPDFEKITIRCTTYYSSGKYTL